jgi:hypothetical protein
VGERPLLREFSAASGVPHAAACHRAEHVAAMPDDDPAAGDGAAATMTQNV